MKLSFFTFISFLILIDSYKPLHNNIVQSSSIEEMSYYQMNIFDDKDTTKPPIDRRLTIIPFGKTDESRIDTVEKKINTNMMRIPTGPTDTEELFTAQAKTAAKEQVEKRAEMARKRRAAQAAKLENATANTSSFPSIGKLEEEQAKVAARQLLEKRAALAAAKNEEENALMASTEPSITNLDKKKAEREAILKKIESERIAIENAEAEIAKIKAEKKRLEVQAAEAEIELANIEKERLEEQQEAANEIAIAKANADKAARLAELEKERLAKEKAEAEAVRILKEKAEAERLRLAELEKERIAREASEAELERLKKEQAEESRLAALEKERLEREKLEAEEALAKAELDRLAKEKLEAELLAKEKAEVAAAKLERERLEAEAKLVEAEKERMAKERAAAEAELARLESERLKKEKEEAEAARLAKIERERIQNEKAEAARIAQEKMEAEAARLAQLEKELLEKEAALAKAEADRISAENARKAALVEEENKRLEQERLDRERRARAALAKASTEQETILDPNARTTGSEEKIETERERAARYARQNLELYKEGDRKAGWKLANKEKEERKTFEEVYVEPVKKESSPKRKTTSTGMVNNTLEGANIPVSIAGMDSDPIMNKINNVPPPIFKKFYFPINKLENAKAYCYVSQDGTADTTYWLMKSISFAGKTFLITEKYDNNYNLLSGHRERINELGAYIEDYTAYESDGLGTIIPVEYWVEDNESYKWNIEESQYAMLSMNFNSSEFPNYDITTYRERHLINDNTTVDYAGESLGAIVFEDRQTTVYVDNKDEEESYSSSYENYFANGIGLVKYVINKQDKGLTLSRTYVLQKIISYDEWQNKVK